MSARDLRRRLLVGTALVALAMVAAAPPAAAQLSALRGQTTQPLSRDEPVAFTADEVQNDRDNAVVTATGHVEAWQNDHVLRADKVTFDRNTNVAAAVGNVVIVEPDGQVLFADYAELTEGMRAGVLRGMRAILAENGKLIANGARRTEGRLNELSAAVYTTCDLCAQDPTRAPLWQIRARSAVQDTENKRIEYQDAYVDIYGIPVAYFPYLTHVDPSERRGSGLLVPSFGSANHLGAFYRQPYYWAIDDQQDATFLPTVASDAGPNLEIEYRRRFNDGRLTINASGGFDQSRRAQGSLYSKGNFSFDDTYRYGFDIQRASSRNYIRDYRISGQSDLLTSQAYIEGFGVGSYARLDSKVYQGLVSSIIQAKVPYVLPRFTYSYFSEPDILGGRITFTTTDFNVIREQGTTTQRAAFTANWQRTFTGQLGDLWTATFRTDAAAYTAAKFTEFPNYGDRRDIATVRAQPNGALEVRWPFVRDAGRFGTQLIEPIAQIVVGPNTGSSLRQRIPDEDSVDLEFTDQNLFAINKFPGLDRQEGGVRANVGLHVNWTIAGSAIDALVGESFRTHRDDTFLPGSGLEKRASDIVGRVSFTPTSWLDVTGRARVDHNSFNLRFADAVGSVGVPLFKVGVGYLYSAVNPYTLFDVAAPAVTLPAAYFTHRNEVSLSASSQFDRYKFSGYVRRDVNSGRFVAAGGTGSYEDECFIFDVRVNRRFTSVNGDSGSTTVLFEITLKTVGQFGYKAF